MDGITVGRAVGLALALGEGGSDGDPVALPAGLVGLEAAPVGVATGEALGVTLGRTVTTGTGDGLGAMQGAGIGDGGGAAFKMMGVGGDVGLGEGEGVGSITVPSAGLTSAEGLAEGAALGDGAVASKGCGAALTETHGVSWVN